jgi:uncharacterized protein YkwD
VINQENSSFAWICLGCLALIACAADGTSTGGERQATTIAGTSAQGVLAGATGPAPIAGTMSTGLPAVVATAGSGGASAAPAIGAAGAAALAAGSGAPAMLGAGTGSRPMTGAAGSASVTPAVTNPMNCPAAPMGATPQATAALAAVNTVRIAAGAGCANLVNTISDGATAHCNYYTMYMRGDMCIADPHAEVMGCMGFTGANFAARSKAAGYTGGGSSEIMAFLNNPQGAVDTWVNSVWHRTPLMDPSSYDMGYGFAAGGCDVIDFGRGMTAPATALVVYPYDGQTNAPPSFNGALEGPMPPAPASGWPSGLPVSVHGKGLAITEHVITLDGDPTPIEHMWLDANTSNVDASLKYTLKSENFMYTNKPLTANTKYHVKVSGTYAGGMLMKEWSFTTGAARRF